LASTAGAGTAIDEFPHPQLEHHQIPERVSVVATTCDVVLVQSPYSLLFKMPTLA
jgi:hypothetical protein